jgi:hypothetical protein
MKNQVQIITINPDLFGFFFFKRAISIKPTRAGDVKHRINFEPPKDVSTCAKVRRTVRAVNRVFFIVSRCHALLTVAMNSHSEGMIYARGRVTLFFANCFSANKIQVFHMKV